MDLFDIIAGRQGSGGGSEITDQSYNPKSQNAQSGIAVAQAIEKVDQTNKLLNFSINSINSYVSSGGSHTDNSGTKLYDLSITYKIELEKIDSVTETGEVIITPLRTNIPNIETLSQDGYIQRTLLGEIVNINWTIDESILDPEVSGTFSVSEDDFKLTVEESKAIYNRFISFDSAISSKNILIISIRASSPDNAVISTLKDEVFSMIKLAQTNLILEYKKQTVLEELISEVIE